jgi:hypothetical protein
MHEEGALRDVGLLVVVIIVLVVWTMQPFLVCLPITIAKVLQYFQFVDYVVDVLHLGHALLPQDLKRTHSPLSLIEGLMHLSEVANADHTLQLEVRYLWFRRFWLRLLLHGTATTDLVGIVAVASVLQVDHARLLASWTLALIIELF